LAALAVKVEPEAAAAALDPDKPEEELTFSRECSKEEPSCNEELLWPLMFKAERLCWAFTEPKAAAAAAAGVSKAEASSEEEDGLNRRDLLRPPYKIWSHYPPTSLDSRNSPC